MKFSRTVLPTALFFLASFLLFPTSSFAGSNLIAEFNLNTNTKDPRLQTYNNPNLDKQDGFDESEHKKRVQQKPKKKQHPAESTPLQKHNL